MEKRKIFKSSQVYLNCKILNMSNNILSDEQLAILLSVL